MLAFVFLPNSNASKKLLISSLKFLLLGLKLNLFNSTLNITIVRGSLRMELACLSADRKS